MKLYLNIFQHYIKYLKKLTTITSFPCTACFLHISQHYVFQIRKIFKQFVKKFTEMKKSRTELVTENVRSCEHYV